MKRLVQVQEVEGEGLIGFMGKRVTLFCMNYIYTGDLVGVNDKVVRLDNAAIVYETGGFKDAAWKDAQELPHPVYVCIHAVESFMELK